MKYKNSQFFVVAVAACAVALSAAATQLEEVMVTAQKTR